MVADPRSPHVYLYDGVCALCNRAVQFLLRHDRRGRFRFAALQSGFAREAIMAWCEANDVHYVLGLAKNARLGRAIGGEMEAARKQHLATEKPARIFREMRYQTRKSWTRERRVVAKAEHIAGKANPRFDVQLFALLDRLAEEERRDDVADRG